MPNVSAYLLKTAEKAKVSNRTIEAAIKLLCEADKKRILVGKDPRGLAAGLLYAASRIVGEKVPQRELAHAADVTEVTVRNRYKELCKALEIEIPHQRKTTEALTR